MVRKWASSTAVEEELPREVCFLVPFLAFAFLAMREGEEEERREQERGEELPFNFKAISVKYKY